MHELNQHYRDLLEGFKSYLALKKLRSRTDKLVFEYLKWLQDQGVNSIKKLTAKHNYDYYEYITKRPNKRGSGTLSDSSIKHHLGAINRLLENAFDRGIINSFPAIPSHKKSDKIERNYLTVDEIVKVNKTCRNPMEEVIIALAYGCGLRRSELQDLKLSDIDININGRIIVREGKFDKRREIYPPNQVLRVIQNYIRNYRDGLLRNGKFSQLLLINKHGNPMSGQTANEILKEIILRTKDDVIIEKNITLHCLRHSIAHHAIESEMMTLDDIRRMLGHSFLDTAQIYAIKQRQRTYMKNKFLRIR